MELFFTEGASLRRSLSVDGAPLLVDGQPYALPEDAARALMDAAIPDGMPFVLGDDARYDAVLNKFFSDLPASGCPSPNTWRAYARDVVTFCRFLAERCQGKRLVDTTMDDMRHYYRTRRMTGVESVDPTTWNRSVSALDKFFRWAKAEELICDVPFTYTTSNRDSMGQAGHYGVGLIGRNEALERAAASDAVKCVSLEDYLIFRNVGLLGQLPDGRMDPAFRGRNRLRNAAFSEFLVTTGVRLAEGGSLLKVELPDPEAVRWNGFRCCKLHLARQATKGNKGRAVWVSKRVLREYVLAYLKEDRDNAVLRAADAGAYRSLESPILVSAWRMSGCTVRRDDCSDLKVDYDSLSPGERARVFSVDGDVVTEPGGLWLTEQGLPTTLNNFEAIFLRACERCWTFGYDLAISPHTLRHTFAVYMLSHLIKGVISKGVPSGDGSGESVYRRVVADPLRTLQRMMGHASITTTYKYLTYIEEAEELVDTAVASWGDRLGDPADHLEASEFA